MMDAETATTVTPTRRRLGLIEPLRIRDFRLVFGGETVSMLGDQFHFVALAWLALQLTGSGLALGSVLTIGSIPRVAFMLVGGAYSDRLSPRSVMLVSNAVRAVIVALLSFLVLTHNAQLWHLFVLAAIFGIFDAFFWPALSTIVPMLTEASGLAAANGLMQSAQQLTGLLGPALAGILVATVQTGPAFAIDAASFAVAALALAAVRGGRRAGPADAAPVPRPGLLVEIRSGIAYAMQDRAIRTLLLLTAAFNLAFNGPISVGIAWAARDHWGGSAVFGILLSAFGLGALGGALLAGSLDRIPKLGWVTLGLAALAGIELAILGFVPSAPLAFVVLLAMGIGIGIINVRVMAWLQARIVESMRGRVLSLVSLGSVSLLPVSYAVAGALVDVAAPGLFAAGGAIVVGACLAGLVWGLPGQMEAEPA